MTSFFKRHTAFVVTAFIGLVAYWPIFIWMWDRWFARDSYYSHGILIPGVTAYLIWQRREELGRLPSGGSGWGIPLVVTGLLVYLVSAPLRIYFSAGFSLMPVVFGLSLYFFGPQRTRRILFPLFFLVFMIPLPEVAVANISFRMKLFAAQIAERLLNDMGFYAVRHGSIITMRHTQVIVDDVCSGLRSLISLTALGSIFAYWLKGPWYKKMTLFLSTVPIAIITNVFRVIILASISEIWGAQYAEGITHDITGYMIFVMAFILLYVVSQVLE